MNLKNLKELLFQKSTPAEDKFRHQIFMGLLPALIIIFLCIAYIVFPMSFGLKNFYQIHNVQQIHGIIFSLIIVWILGKKIGAEKVSMVLPLVLCSVSIQSFLDKEISTVTPYIPFYAGIVSIFFAFAFAKLRYLLIYNISYLTLMILLGLKLAPNFPDHMHRLSVIFVLSPFALAFALSRKKIFLDLEEKNNELLEMSNIQILAEISGGVAHEINNPLAIIMGTATSITKKIEKNDIDFEKIKDEMLLINKTVQRISKITQSLLGIAQKRDMKSFESINFNSVIKDSLLIFEEVLKQKNIELRTHLIDIEVECVPVQIMQIFVNLTSNAIDSIEMTNSPWIDLQMFEENKNLKIIFKDSGNGIPQELADKIMNPFYTTKEVGKGTGLGLSICNRIAKSHQGSFRYLASEANTTFELVLPIK